MNTSDVLSRAAVAGWVDRPRRKGSLMPVDCSACGRTFKNANGLRLHTSAKHTPAITDADLAPGEGVDEATILQMVPHPPPPPTPGVDREAAARERALANRQAAAIADAPPPLGFLTERQKERWEARMQEMTRGAVDSVYSALVGATEVDPPMIVDEDVEAAAIDRGVQGEMAPIEDPADVEYPDGTVERGGPFAWAPLGREFDHHTVAIDDLSGPPPSPEMQARMVAWAAEVQPRTVASAPRRHLDHVRFRCREGFPDPADAIWLLKLVEHADGLLSVLAQPHVYAGWADRLSTD